MFLRFLAVFLSCSAVFSPFFSPFSLPFSCRFPSIFPPFSRRFLSCSRHFPAVFFRHFLCRFLALSLPYSRHFLAVSCHVLAVFSPFSQRIDPFSPQPRSTTLFRVTLSESPFPLASPYPSRGFESAPSRFSLPPSESSPPPSKPHFSSSADFVLYITALL